MKTPMQYRHMSVLNIHLSLSLAYLVTSVHIKFRSGLVANL